MRVVPHGPYYHGPPQGDKITLRKRYGVPLDKQVALFFGDIRPDKNLDLFLQAMVPYKDRLFLVVAGQAKGRDGTGISEYIARAENLGLSGNILWRCEYIPDNEVPNFFELCDWVAMPYSSRFTSQSGVLNVAMAHRRPVLVSTTPTIAETLKNFPVGVVVSPDSLEELRRAIVTFLNTDQSCFKGSIESYLKMYSWEKNASTTALVYGEFQRACVE